MLCPFYFGLDLLSHVNVNLLGFFMLLIYRYFSTTHTVPIPENLKDTVSSEYPPEAEEAGRSSSSRSWSFNIFDGTNATGNFADYVYEGDSEDEANDAIETDRWRDIQDHV